MATRIKMFWHKISDGIAIQQLWSQLHAEARASYRLYSAGIDLNRGAGEKRGHRERRVIQEFFWALVLKLSPARRVLFILALILLFFPGLDFQYNGFSAELPNLSFFGAILFLLLLTLELADRVSMKRDLEIAKEIQTWLMPASPPKLPGIDMAFATRPANTVAGDYYDAFLREDVTPDSPLIIAMADVAGKSIPAALLMATLREVCARWRIYVRTLWT